MIPKRITSCWFGRGPKADIFKKCMDTWPKFNPDWEILEINEDTFPEMMATPYIQAALKRGQWTKATELARLWGVYELGAVYLDCDVELIAPLDSLDGRTFFTRQQDGLINGAAFGAPKGDPLLGWLLAQFPKDDPATASALEYGPLFLTKHILSAARTDAGLQMEILPPEIFYPYFYTEEDPGLYPPQTIGVHRWLGSWARQ